MAAAALLMVVGAASFRAGILIRNHTPLDASLRGVFSGAGLELSRGDYVAALLMITACYLGLLALADAISRRVAIGAIVGLHVIFALGPPIFSSDIFNYVGYARLEVVHHLNPYEYALNRVHSDPTYPHVGWADYSTAYGPLFTLISLPLAKVSLPAAIWLIKGFTAAASLGCVALVAACAKRLGRDPLPAALFVGLNPLLLVFAVGGGHNDLLMMLLALGGIYYLLGDRPAAVGGIVAATAVKLSAALMLPFAILGARDRLRTLLWAVGTAVAGVVLSVLIFGIHIASVRRVLGNIAADATPINIPGFVLNDLLPLDLPVHTQDHVGVAILVPLLAWLLYRTWRGSDWIASTGWATFAVLATTTWLLPWYAVWWLPFAALVDGDRQRYAALAFTVLIVALEVPLIL